MDPSLLGGLMEQGGPALVLAVVMWQGINRLTSSIDRLSEQFAELRDYCRDHGRGKA